MTLLEAMVSIFILATGVAALMGMIISVENANKSMALQNASLDVFARVSAQIRDAECDITPPDPLDPAMADPAFIAGVGLGWIDNPLVGSSITLIGDSDNHPELGNYVPPLIVAYRVRPEPPNPDAAPSFQVDVMVRQLMRDATLDDLDQEGGYYIRVYPVQKLCNIRFDRFQRGEY